MAKSILSGIVFYDMDIVNHKCQKKEGVFMDTQLLLQECNAGCKMAGKSMEQVCDFVKDDRLKKMIEKYQEEHKKLEKETSELLKQIGKEEKAPGVVATAFAWITTETKLMMDDSDHDISKILMDGCNMGIQSIAECVNKYAGASKEAKKTADHLISMEEAFMQELKKYL